MRPARLGPIWGAEEMSANGVNLDALVLRDDFAIGEGVVSAAVGDEKISIAHLGTAFFTGALRKPEFQRETLHWQPQKVVDLVAAFLDRKLVPAVILWRAGNYNFVVDGAHRISALLAWIWNDYGDGERSKRLFGLVLPPEQVSLAAKTRNLMDKQVGPYELYKAGLDHPGAVNELTRTRIGNLSIAHIVAQWVPAATKEAAESSFFTINDAATPIDPTEKRILRSRDSASAIGARAIAHGGSGYPYWKHFSEPNIEKLKALSAKIYTLLYKPPLEGANIDTLDVPVAGRGYSVLPFVFDLINKLNAVRVSDSTNKQKTAPALPADTTGDETVRYLSVVAKSVSRITGKDPGSLGLHPVVYFYTAGGAFTPWAFLAWTHIIDRLFDNARVEDFCNVRQHFEKFLISDKWAMTEIVHKNGSGYRSVPWLEKYWDFVLQTFLAGEEAEGVAAAIKASPQFSFLASKSPLIRLPGEHATANFSRATKTAAIWRSALPGAPVCAICGAMWHRNSIHIDHERDKSHGGSARPDNAAVTHPFCDSTFKYASNRAGAVALPVRLEAQTI